jgi:hypothetical protein
MQNNETKCVINVTQAGGETAADLLYVQITAWGTVALVLATIFMIVWQIRSAKQTAKVQLSMQFVDRYDGNQMRESRRLLAKSLLISPINTKASEIEPVIDTFESIADLLDRGWLDKGIMHNSFSLCTRYWWSVLEKHVGDMRNDYHDTSIYERFEELAKLYTNEDTKRKVPPLTPVQIQSFLTSEAG